jgi:hypothetical protein
LNKKTFKKLNEVELEKENLLAKLDESSTITWLIDSFGDSIELDYLVHKIKSSSIAQSEGSFGIVIKRGVALNIKYFLVTNSVGKAFERTEDCKEALLLGS